MARFFSRVIARDFPLAYRDWTAPPGNDADGIWEAHGVKTAPTYASNAASWGPWVIRAAVDSDGPPSVMESPFSGTTPKERESWSSWFEEWNLTSPQHSAYVGTTGTGVGTPSWGRAINQALSWGLRNVGSRERIQCCYGQHPCAFPCLLEPRVEREAMVLPQHLYTSTFLSHGLQDSVGYTPLESLLRQALFPSQGMKRELSVEELCSHTLDANLCWELRSVLSRSTQWIDFRRGGTRSTQNQNSPTCMPCPSVHALFTGPWYTLPVQ